MGITDIEITEDDFEEIGTSLEEALSQDIEMITTKMENATIENEDDFTSAAEWLKQN
jgi:hypothetical protein